MSEYKQKIASTMIVSFTAFFGFQALSYILELYQIKLFAYVALYIYFFHLFWLTFLFDLHFRKKGVLANARLDHKGLRLLWHAFKARTEHVFKWEYFRHYQNYLILPGLLYWSITVLLFMNPFNQPIKQTIIILGSSCMMVAYWYMKEFFSRRLEAHEFGIQILGFVKIFASFFIYSAIFGLNNYFNLGVWFVVPAIFAATFLLVYQALFQHRLLNFKIYFNILAISLTASAVGWWINASWNSNYLTAGLVVLGVYNTMWGLLHHRLENSLTKKVVVEYLFMMAVILSLLFASHNFGSRVI